MFLYLAIVVTVAGLLAATITDLKKRIVPNKLNFGLCGAGILIYAVQSIVMLDPTPLIWSLIGLCYGFIFGWILWKIGIFAGGDVKLFMALGALNPLTPTLLKLNILTTSSVPLFPITLFVWSLVAFLPYGLGLAFYKLYKNKEVQKKIFADLKIRTKQATHTTVFIAAIYVILFSLGINFLVEIPLLIIWGFLGEKKKYVTLFATIIAIVLSWLVFVQTFVGVAIVIVVLYGLIKVLFSLRQLLSTEIKVSKLEEGMIPAKTLIWKGKKVVEAPQLTITSIIKYSKEHRIGQLFNPGKEIASSRKARGLTIKEAAVLKKLAAKGLIAKTIRVKETMPFVPAIFLGYLICLGLGDIWIMAAGLL